jgi:hypothetical protein
MVLLVRYYLLKEIPRGFQQNDSSNILKLHFQLLSTKFATLLGDFPVEFEELRQLIFQ